MFLATSFSLRGVVAENFCAAPEQRGETPVIWKIKVDPRGASPHGRCVACIATHSTRTARTPLGLGPPQALHDLTPSLSHLHVSKTNVPGEFEFLYAENPMAAAHPAAFAMRA
jgi:hypothetical protein